MKRFLCILLAVLLAASVFGCGGGKTEENSAAATQQAPEKVEEISWVGIATSAAGGKLFPEDDCELAQEFNKRLNIKLKVQKTDYSDDTQMNVMFASGTIPDVFIYKKQNIMKALEQGLTKQIPVDLIKKEAPTMFKFWEQYHPYWDTLPVYKDNSMYALLSGVGEALPPMKLRTDWLKKVNGKMPANIEEFEEVCRLFSKNDPDGNGKDDTYGLNISPATIGNDLFYMRAAYGISDMWREENGSLVYTNLTEDYKNMLKYLGGLFKKGYIHPDISATKEEASNAFFVDGKAGIKTSTWTRWMDKYRPNDWYALALKKNAGMATEYVKPFKGPGGKDPVFVTGDNIWMYYCVGKNVSDNKLKKILQIMELQTKDVDMQKLLWVGREKEHYTLDAEGMAVATPNFTKAEEQNKFGLKYFGLNMRSPEILKLGFGKEFDVIYDMERDWKTSLQLLPVGTRLKAEVDFGADVQKVSEEFMFKAITGALNVDAEWNNYVQNMKKAGIDAYTKEANELYKNSKKK